MIIDGFKIHPELLEEVDAERCVLSECRGACCTGGAWLDVEQLKTIVPHVAAIAANLPAERRDPNAWFSAPAADEDSPAGALVGTNVVDDPRRPAETCCVFLRPDRYCALQVTSEQLGLGYPGLKPLFCALYPLQIYDDEIVIDHATLQDFGGAACRRACAQKQPLHRVFKEELVLILGEEGYRELEKLTSNE
ncbi:hypothetical protein TFLX_01765 [Thermoflexales bacterium]|nr:hypothetical protein TFLX_01765 [Thermoflexales bacterium]